LFCYKLDTSNVISPSSASTTNKENKEYSTIANVPKPNSTKIELNKFKIEDIKHLSKQLLFLTDDKIKKLGEE